MTVCGLDLFLACEGTGGNSVEHLVFLSCSELLDQWHQSITWFRSDYWHQSITLTWFRAAWLVTPVHYAIPRAVWPVVPVHLTWFRAAWPVTPVHLFDVIPSCLSVIPVHLTWFRAAGPVTPFVWCDSELLDQWHQSITLKWRKLFHFFNLMILNA